MRCIPDLTVLRVSALPMPASAHRHQFRATAAGLFWSNGTSWVGPLGTGGDSAPAETVDPWEYLVLPANAASTAATFSDVAGMSFVGQANTLYEVEFVGAIQTSNVDNGAALALDLPSGTPIGQGIHNLAASTLTGWVQNADNATTGAGSGMPATGSNIPITTKWLIAIGGTAGTVQLRLRCEIASRTVTLQSGLCVLKYRKAQRQSTSRPVIPVTAAWWAINAPGQAGVLYAIVPVVAGNPGYRWDYMTSEQYDDTPAKDPEVLYVVKD